MKINPGVFKSYDIRGIYKKDIDEAKYDAIVRAIYTFFVRDLKKKNLTVALGRDMRISSPSLHEVAKKALIQMGANVVDMGLTSTPTFYFSVLHYKVDVGIQISASHNPPEWCGAKFSKLVGEKIIKIGGGSGMEEVRKIALEDDFEPNSAGGKYREIKDVLEEEVKTMIDIVAPKKIKKLKIVADPGNAMGITYLEALFKVIPATLVRMNFELDGTFPAHQPNPLDFKTLVDLQKRVVAERADFGIAPDGDGDRVFFINEKGEIIPATLITCLMADRILKESPGDTVVVDIRYLRNATKLIESLGGHVSISRVGHAHITKQVNEVGAVFAGESSGHYFFRSTGGAESSLQVILFVLDAIGREGKPLSEILAKYHTSVESGEVNFILNKGIMASKMLDTIVEGYRDGTESRLDGLSVTYPDWRFNIRTSNTEPLLRLNVEGRDKNTVDRKFQELTQKIEQAGAVKKD